ncbi:MAG: hypothetical protein R2734_00300 [Nocardioides sp.]
MSAAVERPEAAGEPYLSIESLTVRFPTEDGLVSAVTDLSYSVELGKTLGIGRVGLGQVGIQHGRARAPRPTYGADHRVHPRVGGTEVIGLSEERMRELRGDDVAMIFQDALAALHPFFRIGDQLVEAYLLHHKKASKREARKKAIEALALVGIPRPERRVEDFTSSRVACGNGG